MLIKSICFNVFLATFAMTSFTSVAENNEKLKVAVIKKAKGNQSNNVITFNKNMELCASYLTAKHSIASKAACSSAIADIESMKVESRKAKYLKSLSYSNRAISRYLSDDFTGAMDDMTTAILIHSNTITKSNLSIIKQLSPQISSVSTVSSIGYSE